MKFLFWGSSQGSIHRRCSKLWNLALTSGSIFTFPNPVDLTSFFSSFEELCLAVVFVSSILFLFLQFAAANLIILYPCPTYLVYGQAQLPYSLWYVTQFYQYTMWISSISFLHSLAFNQFVSSSFFFFLAFVFNLQHSNFWNQKLYCPFTLLLVKHLVVIFICSSRNHGDWGLFFLREVNS